MENRDFCPRCGIKHLAKAKARIDRVRWVHKVATFLAKAHLTLNESKLGYPHHVWYAMGNMSEAEDEIVDFLPAEAQLIRIERLQMQDALAAGDVYTPNFKALMYAVARAAMLEEVQ